MAVDPMCVEAGLYTSPKAIDDMVDASVHSIACDPRPGHASRSQRRGVMGKLLDDDFNLVVGHSICLAVGAEVGPSFLFEPNARRMWASPPSSMR
jgi:hypothetical protein